MFNNIIVLLVNFLIGAIGLFVFIRKKKIESTSYLIKKYFSYLFIVIILLVGIRFLGKYLPILFSIIILSGIYEIIKVSKHKKLVLVISILFFLLIGNFFILFGSNKWEIVAWVYTLVVIFDGYSQICGQLFGKHLMIPKISPRKTWEGFVGGILLTYISAYFLKGVIPYYYIMIFIVIISSMIGDLLASYLKRLSDVKDFSKLIPGHGGILDRFDSFIFSGCIIGLIHILYQISTY
jgi:phosphatidate cytidylyltransferase